MAGVTGYQVNSVLRMVRDIFPGNDPDSADQRLTLLTATLCIASRSCSVDLDTILENVDSIYNASEQMELKPLEETLQ